MPLRILYVIIGLHQGGSQQAVLNLIRNLDRRRFHVTVCVVEKRGDIGKEVEALGIQVLTLGHMRQPIRTVYALVRLIRERGIDLVDGLDHRASWYARAAGMLASVPVRVSHEQTMFHHRRWQRVIVNRLLAPGTDGFVAVSKALKEQLMSWYGFRADKIEVIHNGVDTKQFYPPVSRTDAKRRMGLDPNRVVVGMVARLDPVKGHRFFFEAIQELRHHVEAVWLVVGLGTPENERKILGEADELGVSDTVRFLGGRRDVADWLSAFDVYVLPTLKEGGPPISVLEAMATGCAVVVSDFPVNAEAVQHGKNGLIVPMKDAKALAKSIQILISDPALRNRIGTEARRTIENEFSIDRFVRHTAEYYERLWTNRRRV